MYFLTQGGRVFHVLGDVRTGIAPCGARLSRLDLLCLERQRPTRNVFAEKPEDAPLCKQCERQEEIV
jgi:hypothetical protein